MTHISQESDNKFNVKCMQILYLIKIGKGKIVGIFQLEVIDQVGDIGYNKYKTDYLNALVR